MNEVDQRIRDYYAEQSLNDASLERIVAAGKMTRPPWWRQRGWQAAAVFALLAISFPMIAHFQTHRLTVEVGREVLANHEKRLDPEAVGVSFPEIQSALPRLGFALAPSNPDLLAGWAPIGGRYCSLRGELAAQIALINDEGERATLYVAPLNDAFLKIDPCVQRYGNVEIQFWRDAHRLYVQANNL